jgi:hypothetical protein
MQVSAETVESITLSGFEEAVAAYAAVHEVYGEDHPLLQITSETAGPVTGLWGEIIKPEDAERDAFEGKDAAAIQNSLETIARPGSSSPYQATARNMLGLLVEGGQTLPAAPAEPKAPVVPRPLRRLPRSVNGEIVEGHIELGTFGHLVTALRSVEDFAEGDDQRDTTDRIQADITEADPFNTEPVVYWETEAQTIYNALVAAAGRASNVYDLSAGQMLAQAGGEAARPLPAAA